MSTAVTDESSTRGPGADVSEQIEHVDVSDTTITFILADERTVSVPLSWSWRLQEATPEERRNFEISPSGYSVHWPDVDEDLSARGALRGTPAPRPSTASPPSESPNEWTPSRIRRLRKHLGLSQAEFGDRMGIRQATVSDWETGKQTPSPMARRLLDQLSTSTPDDESASV